MKRRITGLLLVAVPLSLVFIINCAQAGKKDERTRQELLERIVALQETLSSQGNTIESLTAQVSAQTEVIQQLATAETPDIIVDNNVDGQMTCVWEED